MALQFNTIGFINFNKDYNKLLKSGAITVSFTSSQKNKDGEYETQYFNGLIPAKLAQKVKPFLNKELVKISVLSSDEDYKAMLEEISTKLNAEPVCYIGKKLVVYRFSMKKKVKHVLEAN